jgi:hypothetical protein
LLINLTLEFVIALSLEKKYDFPLYGISEWLLISRFFKGCAILMRVPMFNMLLNSFVDFLPYSADLFGVTLFAFYLFAAIGMFSLNLQECTFLEE